MVKHLPLRDGEVISILTSDRLDRVTSLNNHGLLSTDRKEYNRKLTSNVLTYWRYGKGGERLGPPQTGTWAIGVDKSEGGRVCN